MTTTKSKLDEKTDAYYVEMTLKHYGEKLISEHVRDAFKSGYLLAKSEDVEIASRVIDVTEWTPEHFQRRQLTANEIKLEIESSMK